MKCLTYFQQAFLLSKLLARDNNNYGGVYLSYFFNAFVLFLFKISNETIKETSWYTKMKLSKRQCTEKDEIVVWSSTRVAFLIMFITIIIFSALGHIVTCWRSNVYYNVK